MHAEGLEFLFGNVGLGEQALGFTLEPGEGSGSLGLFIPGLGYALDQLHGGATVLLGLLLGGGQGAYSLLSLGLMALGGLAGASGFGCSIFEKAAVLLKLAG